MKKMNEYDEVETNTKRIMKHAKEKWVAQTMERVYHREMEKIPQRLYARLIQIPDTSNILEKQSSMYATWLIAACVCLVVTVNIFTLESVKQNSGNKSSDYYEYFSFLESIS